MRDICGDYRDERQQGAGRWEALVGSIRFWVDDREDPDVRTGSRPTHAGAPVRQALPQRSQ
jgi:hypothetical protein